MRYRRFRHAERAFRAVVANRKRPNRFGSCAVVIKRINSTGLFIQMQARVGFDQIQHQHFRQIGIGRGDAHDDIDNLDRRRATAVRLEKFNRFAD